MMVSPSKILLPVLGACALAACDSSSKPKSHEELPGGRFVIVQVAGIEPGTQEVLTLDTATGQSFRLVKSTDPEAHDDIGWHPIADLTIESRTPYYRSRPDLRDKQFQGE